MKHLALASLLTIGMTAIGHADTFNGPTSIDEKTFDKLEINGPAQLNEVTADMLISKGPLKFHELTVHDKMDVEGTLHGNDLKCKDLKVKGEVEISQVVLEDVKIFGKAELERITVSGDTEIHGDVSITHGRLKDVELHSEEVNLDDTYTEHMVVKGQEATVILKGDTVISGDIVFPDGDGIVKKGHNAHITGQVEGGTIESIHRWGLFGGTY